MYFKVYLEMFKQQELKNLTDIFLYSFLCAFAKEGENKVYSHYTNQQLVDIFGCTHQTISNSVTRLEKLGLVKRFDDTRFSYTNGDFYCKRTLVTDTEFFNKYAVEDYISVKSHWLTEWKLPIRAVQLLGIFWSAYFKRGKSMTLYTTSHDLIDLMGNVNYRTYINNLNLLKDLGLITELTPKNKHEKEFFLSVKYLGDDVSPEEVIEAVSVEDKAQDNKGSVGKFNTLLKWAKRYLRSKSSKVVNKILKVLDPYITVKKSLEPLWQVFNFYERANIRAMIPEDADPRDGYFVQGEGYA
jgi:hypothetical protein|nr:MAG TPA: replisome organizer [Caudoviricetes sp.]